MQLAKSDETLFRQGIYNVAPAVFASRFQRVRWSAPARPGIAPLGVALPDFAGCRPCGVLKKFPGKKLRKIDPATRLAIGSLSKPTGACIQMFTSNTARMDDSDFELLEKFVAQGDEAAFSAVVGRHGAMVRGICERVLGDPAGADDACQATFVMLAVKAPDLSRRRWRSATLASWLYRVAFNKSIELCRRQQSRRRTELTFAAKRLEAARERASQAEILAALDQELAALPDRYQSPLVLCHLEGKTQQEAARLLGLSYATVRRRLERGRSLLQSRLARRGLILTAAAVAALGERSASAAPTVALPAAGELLKAAAAKKLACAAPSGLARFATAGKLKIAAAALAGIGGLAGWQFAAQRPPQQPPASQPPAEKVAEATPDAPAAAPRRSIAQTMIEERSANALAAVQPARADELSSPGDATPPVPTAGQPAASASEEKPAPAEVQPAAPNEANSGKRTAIAPATAPTIAAAPPESPNAGVKKPSSPLDPPQAASTASADLDLNLRLHPPPPPRRMSPRVERRRNLAARRQAEVEARGKKADSARQAAEAPPPGDEPQDEPQDEVKRESAPSPAGVETLVGVDAREAAKPTAPPPRSETPESDPPK